VGGKELARGERGEGTGIHIYRELKFASLESSETELGNTKRGSNSQQRSTLVNFLLAAIIENVGDN
jgi:hypothetical protein